MRLDKNDRLSNVQAQFASSFPFLKIEFYKGPYNDKVLLSYSKVFDADFLLGNCVLTKESLLLRQSCAINISPGRTVSQLEMDFWTKYGLSIKVFRHSGNLWIETTLTRAWTLMQQNKAGQQMSPAGN